MKLTNLQNIKVYHIKLSAEMAKWASPSMTAILKLMLEESCLIFFYDFREQRMFHSVLLRNNKHDDFEKKHVSESLWAYCNKNDKNAMIAMLKLPKLTKFVRIAPLVDTLIQNGSVEVIAQEDIDAIYKKYHKSEFFKVHKKELTSTPTETSHIIKIN